MQQALKLRISKGVCITTKILDWRSDDFALAGLLVQFKDRALVKVTTTVWKSLPNSHPPPRSKLARMALEGAIPKGILNVVTGTGPEAGA
ncbi:MAG: hypothetical protein C5B58_13055 [Acidobacteria bacterium]|nr:MAG: hypothetical protein C5B58_13055 [Acidobacteriota bacterium]